MSVTGLVLRVHDAIYQATDGRIGHSMIGVPTLLLRTTGRRTGATRTNSLVYARDGENYLVVPSNGGADQPPAWLYNVRAKPEVEVQVGRERRAGTARIVESSDPDYARLWKIVNDNNHDRYNGYQRKTSRSIQVVVVTPGGAATPSAPAT
jgi:deazaflavin-dependent oxidoreductase (nitroreductase family)